MILDFRRSMRKSRNAREASRATFVDSVFLAVRELRVR